MIANNLKYAEESTAPTKIRVGHNRARAPKTVAAPPLRAGVQQGGSVSFANGPIAPTTVSVPPLRAGVQEVGSGLGSTTSVQRGYGIGEQFHRPQQNSIHVGGHANNIAPTVMSVGPNGGLLQLFLFLL